MNKYFLKFISFIILFSILFHYEPAVAKSPNEKSKPITNEDEFAPTGFLSNSVSDSFVDTKQDFLPQNLEEGLYPQIAEVINPLWGDPNDEIRTRAVEIKDGYVYSLTRDNFLFVYDISDLKEKTTFTTYSSPITHFNVSGGIGLLRYGDCLYVYGYNGLQILDIQEPNYPKTIKTKYDLSIYNLTIQNNFLIATGRNKVAIYNISDPTNPILLSTYFAENKKFFSAIVYGDYLYASEFEILDDIPNYIYGFRIIDFSNPSKISLIKYITRDEGSYHMKILGNRLIECQTRSVNLWSLESPSNPELLDTEPASARVCELDDYNYLITNGKIFNLNNNSIETIYSFDPLYGQGDGFPYGSVYNSKFIFLAQSERVLILKKPPAYDITGHVVDKYYLGLGNVKITSDNGIITTTADNGSFSITLPKGFHTIWASKSGFSFFPSENIILVESDIAEQDFNELICGSGKIPLYLQGYPSTPSTLPNKPYWYDDSYGNYLQGDTYNTVGRWGCNLSCAAMSTSYFGLRFKPTFATDPGILNSWMRDYDGYDEDNGVIYSKIADYGHLKGINIFLAGISGVDNERLNNHICSGNPAMLRVKTIYGDHFVLATGKINLAGKETYTINDPAYGETTLLEKYNDKYYEAYYYMLGPSVYDRSILEITAHSPIHLVITDPLGRRTGYDPISDTRFDEIPNAGYSISSIGSSDDSKLPEKKVVLIPKPIAGEYNIKVIGYDSGNYVVKIYNTDAYGTLSAPEYLGETYSGLVDEISITVEEKPEFSSIFLPLITSSP